MQPRFYDTISLLKMGLTSPEFHAMVYIGSQYADGEAKFTTTNLASIMGVHRVTASGIVKSLIDKGVLARTQRGVYAIHTVNRNVAPALQTPASNVAPALHSPTADVAPALHSPVECSPSTTKKVCHVSTSSKSLVASDRGVVIEPKGSITTPGAAPREMHTTNPESLLMIDYDEPDGLAAVGLTQPRKVGTAQDRKQQRRRSRL